MPSPPETFALLYEFSVTAGRRGREKAREEAIAKWRRDVRAAGLTPLGRPTTELLRNDVDGELIGIGWTTIGPVRPPPNPAL